MAETVARSTAALAHGHQLSASGVMPRHTSAVKRLDFEVQADYLSKYTRSPLRGVLELIWNALDADAEHVRVTVERNEAEGIDAVHVADDGHGMTPDEVETVFKRLGGSWKASARRSRGGRPLHGKFGAGRLYAFGLRGAKVLWTSVAEDDNGRRWKTKVEGLPGGEITGFLMGDPEETDAPTGTIVSVHGITEDPRGLEGERAVPRLTSALALQIEAHRVDVRYDGQQLDPGRVQLRRADIDVDLEAAFGPVRLTVIEWQEDVEVEPILYLCSAEGASLEQTTTGGAGIRRHYTAYARWDGFNAYEDILALDGFPHPDVSPVLDAVRGALARYWDERERAERRGFIEEWRAQKVYPYPDPPKTMYEEVEQSLFEAVATAAAPAVNTAQEVRSRRYTLGLLREALLNGPSSIRRVLEQVLDLPPERLAELDELLQETSLSAVVAASRKIADRLTFLEGLRHLVFDPNSKRRLRERTELHRIIEPETWIFGEEYALTASDRNLETVLKRHLRILGREELSPRPVEGGQLRVDLMLARSMQERTPRLEHLVIELKRPSTSATQKEANQIINYARAVAGDEQFDKAEVAWDFILVTNKMDGYVEELASQPSRPRGVIHDLPDGRGRVWARTWGQIILECQHRHKFVQRALEFNPTDAGVTALLDRLRESRLARDPAGGVGAGRPDAGATDELDSSIGATAQR